MPLKPAKTLVFVKTLEEIPELVEGDLESLPPTPESLQGYKDNVRVLLGVEASYTEAVVRRASIQELEDLERLRIFLTYQETKGGETLFLRARKASLDEVPKEEMIEKEFLEAPSILLRKARRFI